MYKVLKYFTDLHDNAYPYQEGDVFPRNGIEVSKGRLEELSTTRNKQGIPLIREVEEPDEPEVPEIPEEEPKEEAKKKKSTKKRKKSSEE